jgi:ribosome biogenesis GTPase
MFVAETREDYPAVGDWVAITDLGNELAVIHGVLPRKTIMKRKTGDSDRNGEKDEVQVIATNIDVAFVIESVNRDYNLNRFERYFAIAENGGVRGAIILNKIDLISDEELQNKLEEIKNRFDNVDVIATSTVTNTGLEDLKKYIERGKTYCFLGSSGVGKSSLINTLLGENTISTAEISTHSDRGKHRTTNRQMYILENGGIVIDNPGVREVGIADAQEGVRTLFDEMTDLAENCKYTNCTHISEPQCAIRAALEAGEIDEARYTNYLALKKEAEFAEMSKNERRDKDKQFGKFVKSALKDVRKYKN